LNKVLLSAIFLIVGAAGGFVFLRDAVEHSVEAKSAVTEADTPATLPSPAPVTSSQIRAASLRKEGDGHFWATAYVNGQPVRFLVDTGASLVALTKQDARKIGVDTDNMEETAEVRTAAGRVKAAVVNFDAIEIDGVTVKNVQAVVIEKGLESSLLGMSFLNRLDGYEVTPNAIVLRQ
jgi:aspartyl protease family protein